MEEHEMFGLGGSGALIILFLIIAMMGGGFGFGRAGEQAATSADVQRATDFAALERQNNESVAATRQAAYDVMTSIKDASYNNLGEIRTLESAVTSGFANMQNCCCETLRAIDGVNYNGAINTASINANTTAQVQKILDAISVNRMADMQNQINALQLQNAMCGVVRYPNASTYAVTNPFCGCNSASF